MNIMDYSMFNLSEEQNEKVRDFIDKNRKYSGAIGGQFTWNFTPTSIGMVIQITDNLSKEVLDVSNYNEW
jgi:hypothetical protein